MFEILEQSPYLSAKYVVGIVDVLKCPTLVAKKP